MVFQCIEVLEKFGNKMAYSQLMLSRPINCNATATMLRMIQYEAVGIRALSVSYTGASGDVYCRGSVMLCCSLMRVERHQCLDKVVQMVAGRVLANLVCSNGERSGRVWWLSRG